VTRAILPAHACLPAADCNARVQGDVEGQEQIRHAVLQVHSGPHSAHLTSISTKNRTHTAVAWLLLLTGTRAQASVPKSSFTSFITAIATRAAPPLITRPLLLKSSTLHVTRATGVGLRGKHMHKQPHIARCSACVKDAQPQHVKHHPFAPARSLHPRITGCHH
jgi:hypothetical protein